MKTLSRLSIFMLALLFATPARAQVHFTDCVDRTGNNATVIIPSDVQVDLKGQALEAGDEIAVFAEGGSCAGVVTWTGTNAALTAWADDPYVEGSLGLGNGDRLQLRIWSAAENVEYGVIDSVAATFSSERPYYNSTGIYTPDGIYVVKSLVVVPASGDGTRGGVRTSSELDPDGRSSGGDVHWNYPNPFQSTTTIAFSLARSEYVTVDVLDTRGRTVGVLLAAYQPAGEHELHFDGSGLPSGLYLCRLAAESFTEVHRMTLVR